MHYTWISTDIKTVWRTSGHSVAVRRRTTCSALELRGVPADSAHGGSKEILYGRQRLIAYDSVSQSAKFSKVFDQFKNTIRLASAVRTRYVAQQFLENLSRNLGTVGLRDCAVLKKIKTLEICHTIEILSNLPICPRWNFLAKPLRFDWHPRNYRYMFSIYTVLKWRRVDVTSSVHAGRQARAPQWSLSSSA